MGFKVAVCIKNLKKFNKKFIRENLKFQEVKMKIWKVNIYLFLFIDNYCRIIEKEKGIKMKLEKGRWMHAGTKNNVATQQRQREHNQQGIITVLHNKELWLFRNMQNLFSLCFRNNYI